MNDPKIYVDSKGYDEYINSIELLLTKLQNNSKGKSSSYEEAIGDGWHDNFAFEEAKRQELNILQEINNKRKNIKNLVIVKKKRKRQDLVDIDDIIRLKIIFSKDDEEIKCFKLIGGIMPKETKDYQEITLNSLLGNAIYNKKIGTIVNYSLENNNVVEVNIIEKVGVKNDD